MNTLSTKAVLFTLLGCVFVIGIGGAGFIYYFQSRDIPPGSGALSSPLNLNEHYVAANKAFDNGQYQQAYELYLTAAKNVTRPSDQGVIQLKSAIAIAYIGKYEESINELKRVANNVSYRSSTRGYAVQEMANIFYRFNDEKITQAIFSTEPYASIIQPNDERPIRYRKLYEYALSLYGDLPLARLYIAQWYADALQELLNSPATSAPSSLSTTVSDYKKQIQFQVEQADQSILKRQDSPSLAAAYDTVLNRKAALSAKLFLIGEKNLLGDPEKFFQEAISVSNDSSQSTYTKYAYASFLARAYGVQRKNDIATLLEIYPDLDGGAPIIVSFRNAANQATEIHQNLVLLSSIDVKFKTFLQSIGWTETAFRS